MAAAVQCPNSLVAFFPADIYRSVASSAVLPELLRAVDQEKLSAVQFPRNGAVRLTYKSTADCDAAIANGISYSGVALRVVGVEARSHLVYLRDCPTEVSDSVVRGFFASFGEVHSVSRSCHDAFPGLFDGNRLVKMTMTKDIPASVRVAGYGCRVWYRRQPAFCVICKKMGHRGKSCALDGLCRRCRQPGHVARECRNAWGATRAASAAPSSSAPSSAPPSAVSALSAAVPSSDVAPASGVAAAAVPPSAPVPLSVLLSSAALAPEVEESDMDFVPAPVGDDPESASDEEMCSGDEEVIREAAVAVAAAAAAADTPSSPRHSRRSRRNRRSRSKYRVLPVPGVDISSVDMDLSPEDDPDSSKLLRSFDEVWHDRLSWEELRSTRHGRVLKKVGDGILSVESAPVLLFGARSGVEDFPCSGEAPDELIDSIHDSVWSPSSYRVRLPDPENETSEVFLDLGFSTSRILDWDIGIDCLRLYWYEDNPDLRPAVWFPTDAGQLPPLPPEIPPSSFSVFVAWDSSE